MKKIRWSIVLYSLLGILSLVGMAMLMSLIAKKADEQACRQLKVVVQGKETFINQQDISQLILDNYGNVIGVPLKDIETQKIEQSLLALPYVAHASVFADMNGILQINVQQREVILRIINARGKEYYVDTQGKKIPVTLKYVPHVLVANGYIRESYDQPLEPIDSELVRDLVTIAQQVRGDQLWENQIVQLYVNNERDIEIVPRVGKEVLLIGNAEDLQGKLDRLEIYYKNILPKVGTEAYQKVNVKYGGQIICERRDGWFIDSLQMMINN